MFKKTINVSLQQRVFVYRDQQLIKVLKPGQYQFRDWANKLTFETFDINELYYSSQDAIRLYHAHPTLLQAHIEYWKLTDSQAGLLYFNDMLRGVVAPGESLYVWRDAGDVRLTIIDIEQHQQLDTKTLQQIQRSGSNVASKLIRSGSTVPVKPVADIMVSKQQLGILYIDDQFVQPLTAGHYGFWQLNHKVDVVLYDMSQPVLNLTVNSATRELLNLYHQHHEQLADYIQHWKLQSEQVALLYINELLHGVVAPGEHLYAWRHAGEYRLDIIEYGQQLKVDARTLHQLKRAGANTANRLIHSEANQAQPPVADFIVDKQQTGLLYIDGEFQGELPPGQHGYWRFSNNIEVKLYTLRSQLLEINGQEILSKDRVSLRVNLTASIRVRDAQLAARSVDSVNDFVYKTLQLALRETIGVKTLDDLLIDKLYVNETVQELVTDKLSAMGVELESVGMKDIILPGEMKAILNQVVEAQKEAEANVIKRREETAATRSLHNTAKVMDNNPTLLRLKELETLEKISDKISNLNVYGGLEGLMNGTIKLN